MEASQLVRAFRQRADDVELPYLFDDTDVLAWASEAEREACLRALLIFDRTRPSVCYVPVVAGVDTYKLSPLIIRVESVWLDRLGQFPGYRRRRLWNSDQTDVAMRGRMCRDYGNLAFPMFEPGRVGSLRCYAIDGQNLQLFGTPDQSYLVDAIPSYLRMEVYRLPLEAMEGMSDEPEIPEMHQDGLIDWMLYRAFSGKDGEELDDRRAIDAEARFTARYGPRPSASQVRMQAEGRRWRTKPGGY